MIFKFRASTAFSLCDPLDLNFSNYFKLFHDHALMFHYENKTNDCVLSDVNLLQHKCLKYPTCFGHMFWSTSGRYYTRAVLQRHQNHCTNIIYYLLTHSMVQSPFWEANWFAASQEIPRISRNSKVHYRTHKRPPPVSPGLAKSSPYTHIPPPGDPS